MYNILLYIYIQIDSAASGLKIFIRRPSARSVSYLDSWTLKGRVGHPVLPAARIDETEI